MSGTAVGRRRVVVCLVVIMAGAPVAAQQAGPAALPAAAASAPSGSHVRRLVIAGAAGAAAGGVVGARGLSFAGVPPATRAAHEWRAGLTYGAIGGVLAAAIASASTPSDSDASRFWWSWSTTPLWGGIAAVQALDFTSTRYFRARRNDEWLLTNRLVDNRAAFVATEVSAAAAAIGLSYLFHRGGHDRLERWAAVAYIAVGIASAIANYRLPSTGHGLFY